MLSKILPDLIIGWQGLYYLVTSVWPLVSLQTFEAVVGTKVDKFQLYTTTFLITAISIALLSSIRRRKSPEILLLSALSALSFLLVEALYWSSIRPFFYLDFTANAIFFAFSSIFFMVSRIK